MKSDKATIKKLEEENLRLEAERAELLQLKNKKNSTEGTESINTNAKFYTTNNDKEIIRELEEKNFKLRVKISALLKYRTKNKQQEQNPANNTQIQRNWHTSFEDLPSKFNADYKLAKVKSSEFFKSFLITSITQIKYNLENKKTEYQTSTKDYRKDKKLLKICKELNVIKDTYLSKLKVLGIEYNDNDFDDYAAFYEDLDIKLNLVKKVNSTANDESMKTRIVRGVEFDDYIEFKQNLPDYCSIGVLFAQNLIRKDKDAYNFSSYYYKAKKTDKEKKFDDSGEFYEFISSITNYKNPRQYLEHTFENSGNKNLLDPKRLKNVIEYCKKHNLQIINSDFKPQ